MDDTHASSHISQETIGELLKSVLDQTLEGFQIIGRDFRYLYVNKTVAKQGKKKQEELLGKTMMECYPGIEKTPLFVQIKRCMDENISTRMENEFTFPDGSTGWFQLYLHPCSQGVLILSVDITDRKLLEEQFVDKLKELDEVMQVAIDRDRKMKELQETMEKLKQTYSVATTSPPLEQPS